MNFQPQFKPDETFKATNQVTMPEMGERKDMHPIKGNKMTNSEDALAQYRARWTTGNHTLDGARTYLGFDKC